MSKDLVTCGFTTFNSENTIERALLSAIEQDYENKELIIVDDNSTDFTIDRISSFLSCLSLMIQMLRFREGVIRRLGGVLPTEATLQLEATQ
mgnify:CR=1 FL=1